MKCSKTSLCRIHELLAFLSIAIFLCPTFFFVFPYAILLKVDVKRNEKCG